MDGNALLIRETTVRFGEGQRLSGIVTEPDQPGGTAVLLLNAGLVHHAGPACLYVKLARRLAADGVLALRFDFAGIGDSEPRRDGLPFETAAPQDTSQAMDFLAATYGIRRFVLAGICSGAITAFHAAQADERVRAIALMNAQGYVTGDGIQAAQSNRYLLRVSLRRRNSWWRLLRGQVDVMGVLRSLLGRLRRPSAEREQIRGLARGFATLTRRGVRILHLYVENDPGLVELERLMPGARPVTIRQADHMFTPVAAQRQVAELLAGWVGEEG